LINRAETVRFASAVKNAGYAVSLIPDLCATAINGAGTLAEIASGIVIACYPRAIRSIFATQGLKPVGIFDIRNLKIEQILAEIGITQPCFTPEYPLVEAPSDHENQPTWYPVIDRERCAECGKCHDFCLFGVYTLRGKTVTVAQPKNCKNNCPACARICPAKAIIFPKYGKSPINGGLTDEEDLSGTDVKALYNAALRQRLEERRAKVSLFKTEP
jgi:NAD-dependent dihydropyrimidine dehydrogenase PreA subunit